MPSLEMTKEDQFLLAKKLRNSNFTQQAIGETIASIVGREKPYTPQLIGQWLKFESYQEYLEFSKKRFEKLNNQTKNNGNDLLATQVSDLLELCEEIVYTIKKYKITLK